MPDVKNKEFLTTTQAARILSVSPDTVLKWVKAGKIKSTRTLGGHFRIPRSAVEFNGSDFNGEYGSETELRESTFQYCWEYLATDGEVLPECHECITYRSRSKRCYELRDLPEGLGCLRVYCKSNCADCDYYKTVSDAALNIILLSESRRLLKDWEVIGEADHMHIEYARNEYECARLIENFRPDYVVVDCNLGKRRTALVCSNLFNDARIPVARIILASKTKQLKEYCEKEVFGWITKPFSLQQLKDCISVTAA